MTPTPRGRTQKPNALIAMLLAALASLTPSTSRGGGITAIGIPYLTANVTYNNKSSFSSSAQNDNRFHFFIDPQNLESFQLDIQFDPARVSLFGIDYVSPYLQTTPPDLSMLGSGLLQDVAGTSSIFPPPPGDVDIFSVSFADLNPSLPVEGVCFTVFASSNDFLVFVDTASGVRTTYGSLDILPLARCVPDSSSALVNLGVLGVVTFSARFRKMGRN